MSPKTKYFAVVPMILLYSALPINSVASTASDGTAPAGCDYPVVQQTAVPALPNRSMKLSTPDPATVLTVGHGIYEYIPPASWNPISATADELAYYGFPPRPQNPTLLSEWIGEFSDYTGVIAADICDDPSVTHANADNSLWGGVVDTESNHYTEAYTHYNQAYGVASACSSPDIFSSWVGMGGYLYNNSLIQNGTDAGTDVPDEYKGPTGSVGAWWEAIASGVDGHTQWVGKNADFISPTDQMSVWSHYISTPGDEHAVFGWHNLTTTKEIIVRRYTINGQAGAPAMSSAYNGGSADFVNERIGGIGGTNVREFYSQDWTNATATRDGDAEGAGYWGHDLIRLIDGSGYVIARPTPYSMISDQEWVMDWYRCN